MNSSFEVLFKSDKKSKQMRRDGNMLIKQEMFYDALFYYNKSLCFAISEENLALAYANRSMVYLKVKLYSQCLNNIRLAREHGYSEKLKSKLEKREFICFEEMLEVPHEPSQDLLEYVKLSYEKNQKVPFVIDRVEVQSDVKYGRKIIATRPLKVGDIVSIEPPFAQALVSRTDTENLYEVNLYKYCHHCLKNNLLDLIPCSGCNVTMFCSAECEIQSRCYHQYECEIAALLIVPDQAQLAMRTFFKALAIMDGSMEKLEQLFIECQTSLQRTIFDFNFSDPHDPEYKKNQLRVALSLAKDVRIKKFNFPDNIFAYHFKTHKIMTPQNRDFVYKILLHIQQTQLSSNGEVGRYSLTSNQHEIIGACHYLFGSLLNHSCIRNVVEVAVEDKMCIIVIKPIEEGEQLFDSYCDSFYKATVADRQLQLDKFSFICDCEACIYQEIFTMGNKLQSYDKVLFENAAEANKKDYSKLKRDDIISAIEELKNICQAIYSSERFPNIEYGLMSTAFFKCFTTFIASSFKFRSPQFD